MFQAKVRPAETPKITKNRIFFLGFGSKITPVWVLVLVFRLFTETVSREESRPQRQVHSHDHRRSVWCLAYLICRRREGGKGEMERASTNNKGGFHTTIAAALSDGTSHGASWYFLTRKCIEKIRRFLSIYLGLKVGQNFSAPELPVELENNYLV